MPTLLVHRESQHASLWSINEALQNLLPRHLQDLAQQPIAGTQTDPQKSFGVALNDDEVRRLLQTIQALARHANIFLTMNIYAVPDLADQESAVQRFAPVPSVQVPTNTSSRCQAKYRELGHD